MKDPQFLGALTSTEISATYYNRYHRNDVAVVLSKERILLLPIVIYLRKYSCLRSPFNQHVEKLTSGGILEHWINRYTHDKYTHFQMRKTPQVLTLSQLGGIFSICGALYFLAFLVFLMEIVTLKWRCLRNPRNV